jgi:tRNA-2-methylthio-N6-dimethylallyladenosine synthase
MMSHTYYIWTIGCQMNVSDSRRLADSLESLGYQPAARLEDADVMVLNTCVVRQSAEDKVLGRLSSLKPVKKRRPDAVLALVGCFVGQDSEEAQLRQTYPFVDVFLAPGGTAVQQISELARQRLNEEEAARTAMRLPLYTLESPPASAPVCAYTTIIHGCNNFCSYCIVPYRRGREVSRPVDEVVAEVGQLVAGGAREVTLLGQNVDSYGRDLPGRPTLADLLREVHEIERLWRIRFLTSHPKDMTLGLIESVARLPKVCEHIELPVQAGDDVVLRRMNRHYSVNHYRQVISQIRQALPVVSIATDVVVGFPGETRRQFENTYALLEEIRFDAVHIAAYSPRPDTAAALLADDVSPAEKERRRQAVEVLQEQIAGEINTRLLGQTLEVLIEGRHRGKWQGRTRTNKLVFFVDRAQSPHDWRGQLAQVRVTWTGPWSMQGTAVPFAAHGSSEFCGFAAQE